MAVKASRTVSSLAPAPYNPRKITDAQASQLHKALVEFGDLGGIVFNRKTGNVVGGHQRLKTFDPYWPIEITKTYTLLDRPDGTLAEGFVVTPYGRFAFREVSWYLAKEKAANIAANQHGGVFDIPKLKDILTELDDGEFDLELTGFEETDLKALIDWEGLGPKEDADSIQSVPKIPNTKLGELWSLGDHRLLCGDSSKAKNLIRLMQGSNATLVFTDPPYGISIGKKNVMLNNFQKAGSCLDNMGMDDMPPKELGEMLLKTFSCWRDAMADDCSVFVCSPQGGGLGMMMMMMMMKEAGLEIRHILNWVKNSATFSMGRLDYDYQHEPILFTWKKTHKRKKEGAFQTSIWSVDKPMSNKEHPTMKPVELPTCATLNHTDKGDIICDPFLGSGTTLIAAEATGRKCFGMEIAPGYCDVIINRWEKFTGKKAILISSRQPLSPKGHEETES